MALPSSVDGLRTKGVDAVRSSVPGCSAVARLARAALGGAGLDALLNEATLALAEILGADSASVWELTPDGGLLRLRAAVGMDPAGVGGLTVSAEGHCHIGHALVAGGVVTSDDLAADERFRPIPALASYDCRSAIAIPIARLPGEPAYGVLAAHSLRRAYFTREDAYQIDSIANLLSPLLEWRRTEMERELLTTLAVGVSLADGLESAIAAAASSVLLVTGWECAESWIPADDRLRAGPVRALDRDLGARLREANGVAEFGPDEGMPGRAWSSRRAEWLTDLWSDPRFCRPALARELNLQTAFSIPVVSHGRVLAVVIFYGSDRHREDKRLLELIESALAPLGPMVERRQLEEARRRLQAIVDSSDDAIIGKTPEGVIVTWNPAAERIYGYSAAEMIGQPVSVLMPPDRRGELADILERIRRGERVKSLETVQIAKDGGSIEVAMSIAPIQGEKGEVIGASTIARDISERKRVEAQLRQKERELADFVENASEGVHWAAADGTILFANRAEADLVGYTAQEYVGRNIAEFHADPNIASDMMQRLRRGEVLHNYEVRLLCRDGSIKHALLNCDVLWKGGRFVHTRCFSRDVTERKKAEAALRESEERFRTLADSAPVMMWMAGSDGGFTFFNRTWLGFRGRRQEVEVGQGWLEGVHPEDRQRCQLTFETVFGARNALEMEFRMQRFDGEYRWVLNTGVPRHVGEGVFAGFIGSCVDITERKEAEQFLEMHARRQARLIREEVRGRRRAEQRAREQLTQLAHLSRFSTMGEMATGLAHELNQPLCAIVNFTEACLELLGSGAAHEDLRGLMCEVATQAERAGEVIRHMREFVRKREPRRSAVSLNEIIQDVIALIRTQAVRDRAQIELELTGPPVFVWADAIQIQQVLVNLVKNGLEAMASDPPEGRRLVVEARARDSTRVEVAVSDRGVGIAHEDLDAVFTPFRSTKEAGMGMGLSISRSIVEAHDGQIWVTRNADKGVTFHFTLPVARSTEHGSAKRDSVRG